MVIIFVLLVFVLAQAFLSVALSGRDQALDRLGRQMAALSDQLALERARGGELAGSLAAARRDLATAEAARDLASGQLAGLRRADAALVGERDALKGERDGLTARLADAQAARDAALARAGQAEGRLADAAGQADAQAARDADRYGAAIDTLKAQIAALSGQLASSQQAAVAKDAQVADLGRRLDAALASKVAELQRYRSEFFGRLRQVLANRPGIAVVGDRFVFQSEVLFPVGSADLTAAGSEQIGKLAGTLKTIAGDIPPDLNWLLRVDGHADRQRVTGGAFASNWELSSARAIRVVKTLIADGIPPNRLAAAGFADYQPLDPGTSAAALAKNRRIELRLTDR